MIGTLPLAIQTNALIEEPLVRVPGDCRQLLPNPVYFRVARDPGTIARWRSGPTSCLRGFCNSM